MSFYVVETDPVGKVSNVARLDRLTAPKLADVLWGAWSTQRAARLRTCLNQRLEARYGRRTAAGNSQDTVVRFPLTDAAD